MLDSFNFDLDTNGNVLIELDDVLIRDMSPASDEPNDTVKYRPINLSGNQLSGMNLHINTKLYIKKNLKQTFNIFTFAMVLGYTEMVDVTVPVQCLVESGKLTFFDGSKADLAGFYDPCALLHEEPKHLLIRYSYQNCIHQLLLPDEEAVKMPKTAHRLPDVR